MSKPARRRKRHRKRVKYSSSGDKTLLLLVLGMLVFGVVMIYDATAVFAHQTFGGGYKFVFSQILWGILGLLGFLFFYNFHYKNLYRVSYILFGLTIGILTFPAFLGGLNAIGLLDCSANTLFIPCINGAYRWLYLNPHPLPSLPFVGVLGFQPAELAKFALIIYLSVQISKTIKEGYTPFVVFIVSSLLISGLIIMQPNMSTAVLIFLIGGLIYFASGASLAPLFVAFPLFGLLGGLFMVASPYRRQRLLTLIGLSEGNDLSSGYHIKQILIALGSGGFMGLGFGQSRQKYQYLPEVFADSIFAIIGEELGFVGTTLLIFVFAFFVYKGYTIAKKAPDLLGKLLAVGVTSWIGLQFFINVAAMSKIIPLTGIPIPLISYGGSATVFSLMGLGILANVSRYAKK